MEELMVPIGHTDVSVIYDYHRDYNDHDFGSTTVRESWIEIEIEKVTYLGRQVKLNDKAAELVEEYLVANHRGE